MRGTLATVDLGVKSLLVHKLRSGLTTLGILIGVAAVVAMLAIGEGASQAAQDAIRDLGSTNILITSIKPPDEEATSGMDSYRAKSYGLTYLDAERIEKTLEDDIDMLVPVRQTDREVRVGTQWQQSAILGTTPEYLDVMGMSLRDSAATGDPIKDRWISEVDMQSLANVAVLGASAKQRLFGEVDPVNKFIKVTGDRFTVIGVLETLGRRSGSTGRSVDDCIYIPMSASRRRFGDINRKTSGGSTEIEYVELQEIKVQVAREDQVRNAAGVIDRMLKGSHKLDDYDMVVPLELLAQAKETEERNQLMLAFIASISLVVGGIGIMNVMLATVTERTREIGIRRALGAQKKHIVSQFLVETVVLSGAGGFMGLAFGIGAAFVAEAGWGAEIYIKWVHPFMAFCISALVGVIAGIYPAWRAANMDPVEALRHE